MCGTSDLIVDRHVIPHLAATWRPGPSRNSLVAGHVIPHLEAAHDDGAPGGARWSVVRSAVPVGTRSRSVGDTRGGADGEENVSGDRCGGGPAALACRATEDGGGGQPGGGREDDPQVRRRGRGGGDPSGRRSGQRPGRVGRAGGGLVPGAGGRAGAQPDLAGAGGPAGTDRQDARHQHAGHGASAVARRARAERQRVQPAPVCGAGVSGPPRRPPGDRAAPGRAGRGGTDRLRLSGQLGGSGGWPAAAGAGVRDRAGLLPAHVRAAGAELGPVLVGGRARGGLGVLRRGGAAAGFRKCSAEHFRNSVAGWVMWPVPGGSATDERGCAVVSGSEAHNARPRRR